MTNNNKAIELSNKFKCITISERCKNIEDACFEMAKWKEKQFNMIIEKIIDLFDKYPSNSVFSKNNVIEMFKTIKKAMEE